MSNQAKADLRAKIQDELMDMLEEDTLADSVSYIVGEIQLDHPDFEVDIEQLVERIQESLNDYLNRASKPFRDPFTHIFKDL